MIDRNSRNQLILATQDFLDEKRDAFQFDEIIFNINAKGAALSGFTGSG